MEDAEIPYKTDRPWLSYPPPPPGTLWGERIHLLGLTFAASLVLMRVFYFEDEPSYAPEGFDFWLFVFAVPMGCLLVWTVRHRIAQMMRRGPKLLDLGPMPRRLERGLAICLVLFCAAVLAFDVAAGRPLDASISLYILAFGVEPLGKLPFLVFARSGIHREGVGGDFEPLGQFLSWEMIECARLDRASSVLRLVAGGMTFEMQLSGVALDLVERVIPLEKLQSVPSATAPSPDVALDHFAR